MGTSINLKNCRPNNRYSLLSTSESNTMFNHNRNNTQRSMLNRFFAANIQTWVLVLFAMAGLQTGKCLKRFIYLFFFSETFSFWFESRFKLMLFDCIVLLNINQDIPLTELQYLYDIWKKKKKKTEEDNAHFSCSFSWY